MYRASGFLDDIMFSHNGPNTDTGFESAIQWIIHRNLPKVALLNYASGGKVCYRRLPCSTLWSHRKYPVYNVVTRLTGHIHLTEMTQWSECILFIFANDHRQILTAELEAPWRPSPAVTVPFSVRFPRSAATPRHDRAAPELPTAATRELSAALPRSSKHHNVWTICTVMNTTAITGSTMEPRWKNKIGVKHQILSRWDKRKGLPSPPKRGQGKGYAPWKNQQFRFDSAVI